jgi:hypothetical protein
MVNRPGLQTKMIWFVIGRLPYIQSRPTSHAGAWIFLAHRRFAVRANGTTRSELDVEGIDRREEGVFIPMFQGCRRRMRQGNNGSEMLHAGVVR